MYRLLIEQWGVFRIQLKVYGLYLPVWLADAHAFTMLKRAEMFTFNDFQSHPFFSLMVRLFWGA